MNVGDPLLEASQASAPDSPPPAQRTILVRASGTKKSVIVRAKRPGGGRIKAAQAWVTLIASLSSLMVTAGLLLPQLRQANLDVDRSRAEIAALRNQANERDEENRLQQIEFASHRPSVEVAYYQFDWLLASGFYSSDVEQPLYARAPRLDNDLQRMVSGADGSVIDCGGLAPDPRSWNLNDYELLLESMPTDCQILNVLYLYVEARGTRPLTSATLVGTIATQTQVTPGYLYYECVDTTCASEPSVAPQTVAYEVTLPTLDPGEAIMVPISIQGTSGGLAFRFGPTITVNSVNFVDVLDPLKTAYSDPVRPPLTEGLVADVGIVTLG